MASKGASSVCLHDISSGGAYISFVQKVGGRPNGRPNQNYDRSWWILDYGGSYPDYHYDPYGANLIAQQYLCC